MDFDIRRGKRTRQNDRGAHAAVASNRKPLLVLRIFIGSPAPKCRRGAVTVFNVFQVVYETAARSASECPDGCEREEAEPPQTRGGARRSTEWT